MTQIITVLGTGCKKCQTLAQLSHEIIVENNLDAYVEKIEDMEKIMAFDVMSTPALAVDKKVVVSGRIPSKEEILAFIQGD